MNIKPHIIGFVWVRKEDYAAYLRLWADAGKMPQTWEEWLKSAEKIEQHYIGQGYIVEHVYIDPSTFIEWCRINNCGVDADGRHKFVAVSLAEKYRRH